MLVDLKGLLAFGLVKLDVGEAMWTTRALDTFAVRLSPFLNNFLHASYVFDKIPQCYMLAIVR